MSSLAVETELGTIVLRLLPDAAPQTCAYISRLVGSGLYDGTAVYRSDFVIQMGTHGTGKVNAHGNLPVNETNTHRRVSNTRGTVAVAHWDVPDCGNSEIFINLGTNSHLDEAYGGYCVFATCEGDVESLRVVDAIASAVKQRGKVDISAVRLA